MPSVDFRLYLVTDRMQTVGRPLASVLQASASAGLPAVHVRERDLSARELLALLASIRAASGPLPKLLLNDRLDVALAADLDGVHLRSESLPVAVARRLLGDRKLLGVSTHAVEEARHAADAGADFVVFGPIYDTPSKRAYGAPQGLAALEAVARAVSIPVFAIGGISVARVAEVRRAGAFGVAVISALLAAPDCAVETRRFLQALAPASDASASCAVSDDERPARC